MKKIILVLTAVIFLTVSLVIYPGGSEWHDSSASSGDDDGISDGSSESSGDSSESSASISKKRERPEDEAIIIFNEATQNHGERPHLEILARRYEITVEEVIDTVSRMVSNGEIDMDVVLTDRKAARAALARLHKSLEAYSQSKGKI